mgnify:CR=1 FL=1
MIQGLRCGTLLVLSLVLTSCGTAAEESGSGATGETVPAEGRSAGPELSDHSWRLILIDMSDGDDVELSEERAPFVVFSEEANPTGSRLMNGSTGCNNFNATYDAGRGGRLAVSAAVMTRMACPEDVMRVERFFMIGLESARTYRIGEEGLIIDFGGGELHFVADAERAEPAG